MNTRSSFKGKKRTKTGTFAKKCGSLIHRQNESILIDIKHGEKISKAVLERLYKQVLPRRASFICRECMDIGKVYDDKKTDKRTSSEDKDIQTEQFVHTEEEENNEPTTLAQLIDQDVRILFREKFCSDAENITSYDAKNWLSERPKELVQLLFNVTGLKDEEKDSAFYINKCIEQIYCARHERLVLLLAFKQNLLTYSLSNSKLLLNFSGRTMGGGSYTYLKNWLTEHSGQELTVPDGVVKVVFDNEQVVGKRYTVKADVNTSVPVSVITSQAYLTLDNSSIQNSELLKPEHWLFRDLTESETDKFKHFPMLYTDFFRQSRNTFIERRLKELILEQSKKNDVILDEIDYFIKRRFEAKNHKICIECNGANDKDYISCRNCSGKLKVPVVEISPSKDIQTKDIYNHFESANLTF